MLYKHMPFNDLTSTNTKSQNQFVSSYFQHYIELYGRFSTYTANTQHILVKRPLEHCRILKYEICK